MFMKALNIPGSGLTAEQYRLNVIAQNITNAETTRTKSGGPYIRKVPIYQEVKNETREGKGNLIGGFAGYLSRLVSGSAANYLNNPAEKIVTDRAVYIKPEWKNLQTSGSFLKNKYSLKGGETGEYGGVRIPKVVEDPTPTKMVYDPGHPDANEDGYVEMPNVEMVQEMINMMGAGRSYEANVQVVNAMKAMATRALELGR